MAEQLQTALTILRRKQVEHRTGHGRTAIYRGIADGTFPAPIKIGPRSVGWLESEVSDWIKARIASRGADRKRQASPEAQ